MKGGYSGSGDTREPETYLTYLDGDIKTPSDSSDNSYHIVVANDSLITPENCRLDGFVVRNANADGSSADDKAGAGIFVAYACPLVYGCTITNNAATTQGGGVLCLDAVSSTAPAQFRNCLISGNQVTSASLGSGGGLFTNSHVTLINTTIQDNTSERHGGGIGVLMQGTANAKVTLINCRLSTNQADPEHENGGAGGGIFTFPDGRGCDLILTNCLFSENTSHNNGGGLSISETAMDMTNCTIVDCSSGYGGGMATYRIGYGAGTVTKLHLLWKHGHP
jgi:hypothetical protein